MLRARLSVLAFAFPLLTLACGAPGSEESRAAQEDMTASWLEANIPPGSALEAKVLGLVNDRTMVEGRFVSECHYRPEQAGAIMSYRAGDDATLAADDQKFDTVKELDALPFTDAAFWADTVRCAMLHTPGPSVCVPGPAHPPVVLELVVDESGSMYVDGKWAAARDSLLALFRRLHDDADPDVSVGLIAYDTDVFARVAPKPMTDDQLDRLTEIIDTPEPHGSATSTEAALEEAFRVLSQVDRSARRAVVLLSDGVPNGLVAEEQRCIGLTEEAHALGVDLHAVGIGAFPSSSTTVYDPSFMGRLAVAGGTAPAGCNPDATDLVATCHVQITPGGSVTQLKNDLGSSLEAIRLESLGLLPTALPSLSGDTGASPRVITGSGSKHFTVVVTEDDVGIMGRELRFKATLASAPGRNFDLYVSGESSTHGAGAEDALSLAWGEANDSMSNGVSDTRRLEIEVREVVGPSAPAADCDAGWSLTLEGNK